MNPEAINQLLTARVRDLAQRRLPGSADEHKERVKADLVALRKTLGLEPLPPRTEMAARVTGTLSFEGYRLEKLRYESRPGFSVTAHLYIPEGQGPFQVILRPHGHSEGKKSTPSVQASAIGLCLAGFAVLVVDSPGHSWDVNAFNERTRQGTHEDPWLTMGVSVIGSYAWDLMRGLDYLETRAEFDTQRVGITGESGGGQATTYAFALDERIQCAVPVCSNASFAHEPHVGCWCNHIPGLLNLGDRADVLAFQAPKPVLVIGATDDPMFPEVGTRQTFERLKSLYRLHRAEDAVRLEIVESRHDYNRRMREVALAFFREHLMGDPRRTYLPELRPLTDGEANPYPANTLPWQSPELLVTTEPERGSLTFRDLTDRALREPYPEPYEAAKRLIPWRKYIRVEAMQVGAEVSIADADLKISEIDSRMAAYLGLSVAEVLAQWLHYALPGGPEGWEGGALGAGGDIVTSMIASMRTLVGEKHQEVGPTKLIASGPVTSMVAVFLKALRPELQIETSHSYTSWLDIWSSGEEGLFQPGARYMAWPV